MSNRYHRKMAILHKIEATYGTDAAPAAADALIASNVTFTPMEGEEVSRDLMLPYLGNQGVILAGIYARIEFDIEVAGAGAAGDVPKFGSILRICGLSETIAASTSVTYAIVEDDVEAGSLYFVSDKVQHVMLGCQANLSVSFAPKGIPKFRVTAMGLLGTITDIGSMPAVSQTGWTDPITVSKAATAMTLHGWSATAESLSVDLGNKVEARFLIGEENMLISDRSATGTAVVVAKSLATVNWFEIARTRARGGLSLVHGTTAGNIVEVASPTEEAFIDNLTVTNANITGYIRSTNYAEDGDGHPTAGFKFDKASGDLKTAGIVMSRNLVLKTGSFVYSGDLVAGSSVDIPFVNTGVRIGANDVWATSKRTLMATVQIIPTNGVGDSNGSLSGAVAEVFNGFAWLGDPIWDASTKPLLEHTWSRDPSGSLVDPPWASGTTQRVLMNIRIFTSAIAMVGPITINWKLYEVT